MKIIINDFGPIKKFSYDLNKDFIVTYGNNNIGKSYSMQIVYLLLKTLIDCVEREYGFANFAYYKRPLFFNLQSEEQQFKKVISDFIISEDSMKDITKLISDTFYEDLSKIMLPAFLRSCSNTFGNFDKTLEKNPTIEVCFEEYSFTISLKNRKIEGVINKHIIRLKKTKTTFHKSRKYGEHIDIYACEENNNSPIEIIVREIQNLLQNFFSIVRRKYGYAYFLPASRSGIYSGMNAFGSIVAELSKNRAMLTRKIELPGISEPISDYFIFLSNIRTMQRYIKPNTDERCSECYSKIEKDILKGTVDFDKTKGALIYKPNEFEASFEMTEVSSMVSEVSPIVAFLKYILKTSRNKSFVDQKSILFIEEPEAHLHPSNQIALIEIFAQLVSGGVKLIISSHSNYIFNKLNNLVLSKALDYRVYQPIILEVHEKGSVSKCLEIDELGANDENFIDVSEKLYEEREQIIEKLNMENDLC